MKDYNGLPMHHNASPKIFEFAKQNRKNLTEAEVFLWSFLKKKQLGGFRFRQQHPIGSYILDFYCHESKVGIEIDGKYHNTSFQKEYDEYREMVIHEGSNIKVIRFKNEEVMNNIETVLDEILKALKQE